MKPRDPWIELLRVVAHDLTAPITAVKGYIELFQQAGPMTEKQQRFSDRALASLERQEELVKLLLDIAWLDANKPIEVDECDVVNLIDNAAVMLEHVAGRRNIDIHVDVNDDVGTVLGDVQRLSQVVNNLVFNAVKYNRDGGSIWIRARGDADHVHISVRDNGRGIAAEHLPYLFDPYFRIDSNNAAKVEGTGIGLAIVKGVVDKHQGRIWVESAPNEGSTFNVLLPRRPLEVRKDTVRAPIKRKRRKQTGTNGAHVPESNGQPPVNGDGV